MVKDSKGKEYLSASQAAAAYNFPSRTLQVALKKFGNYSRQINDEIISFYYVEGTTIDTYVQAIQSKKQDDSKNQLIKNLTERVAYLQQRQGIVDNLKNVNESNIEIIPDTFGDTNSETTAISLFSDVHLETRVNKEQVGGLNVYDIDIAKHRCDNYFTHLVELIKDKQRSTHLNNLVIGILGDIITGYIHKELEQTNNASPINSTIYAKEIILRGLKYLHDNLPNMKIQVICICGNHGRISEKVQHSNECEMSLEWLVYKDLQSSTSIFGLDNIEVIVPKTSTYLFKVYDKQIAFAHGHHTRYQGGVGGIMIPLNKYFANLNNRQHIDLMCMGHYHSLSFTKNIIVNGSIIGIDSYAYNLTLPYEVPQQALFFLNSKYGIIDYVPVYVQK